MNELYRRQEMPPEPWTHEDNPDWIMLEGDDTVLVLVEPTDRICFVHGATEYDDDECWSRNLFGKQSMGPCKYENVVRVGGSDG